MLNRKELLAIDEVSSATFWHYWNIRLGCLWQRPCAWSITEYFENILFRKPAFEMWTRASRFGRAVFWCGLIRKDGH